MLELSGGVRPSKVDANDMNMGLLAIVVYGEFEPNPACLVPPNPKSICMAPWVAVGCETLSSRRLSTAGSKVVSELQSKGLVIFGDIWFVDDDGEPGDDTTGNPLCGDPVVSDVPAADLGTVKVKEDECLRLTFSDCRRFSKSLKFSFSC